jgi:hypothetical protein
LSRHSWALKTLNLLHGMGFKDVEFHTYAGASPHLHRLAEPAELY